MKFSMMTYSMMRQKCFTPEDCVRTAAEVGMEGIDWVSTYDRDPHELKKMSVDANLTVAAHTFFLRGTSLEERISQADKSLDDACILGAPLVMIPTLPLPGVSDAGENRKYWCETLASVAPMAENRGLILSIENFPGAASPFVTASDFYEAKKEIPSLKLTFDNGNASTGEDQIESLKKSFADVVHVHFKDWEVSTVEQEGFRQMRDGRYYRPALIGEGCVDSRATLKTLEELNYNGFVNIEYESKKYPGDEAVKQALAFLRSV